MKQFFKILLFFLIISICIGQQASYKGDLDKNRYHGNGELLDKFGNKYVGEFFEGKKHGKGVLKYSNAARFEGQFVDGKKTEGTYYYSNGTKYIGKWNKRGKKHGNGIFVNRDGVKENQTWANGKKQENYKDELGLEPSKEAEKEKNNENKAEELTEWEKHYEIGKNYLHRHEQNDTHEWSPFSIMEGDSITREEDFEVAKDQNITGIGFGVDGEGGVFEGQFINGERSQGIQYYVNGERFIGGWKSGVKHGEGKFIDENGNEEKEVWVNGKLQGGDYISRAIQSFKKVIDLKPDHHESIYWLGQIYHDKGDLSTAEQYFNKANELSDNSYIYTYKNLAYEYKRLADYPKSVEFFKKYLDHNPNDTSYYRELDIVYNNMIESIMSDKLRLEKIIQQKTEDISKDSTNAEAYFMLGRIKMAESDSSSAIKYIGKAAKLGLGEAYEWFEINKIKWETYDGDFIKKRIGKYSNGKKIGKWLYYNDFDELEMEEYYVNGKLDGLKTVYKNNRKYVEEHYKNGLRNGLYSTYWDDSTKNVEIHYLNDVIEGKWTQWWSNGQLRIKEFYVNGKLQGDRLGWHKNGKEMVKEHYQSGELHGLAKGWYENGQERKEENYINGILDGISIWWNEDGTIMYKREDKNGKCIYDSRWENHLDGS